MDMLAPSDLIEEVGGSYRYYCYVLSDFNPLQARKLEAECTVEEITHAMMAREAYHRPPEE